MYLYNQLQALNNYSIYKTLINSAIKHSFCKCKTIEQFIKNSLYSTQRHFYRRLASKRRFVWSERKSGGA